MMQYAHSGSRVGIVAKNTWESVLNLASPNRLEELDMRGYYVQSNIRLSKNKEDR